MCIVYYVYAIGTQFAADAEASHSDGQKAADATRNG